MEEIEIKYFDTVTKILNKKLKEVKAQLNQLSQRFEELFPDLAAILEKEKENDKS